jgi:hypothetical protein
MPNRWTLWALAYACLLAAAASVVVLALQLDPKREPGDLVIVSVWEGGRRTERVVTRDDPADLLVEQAEGRALRVYERVVDEAPLLHFHPLVVAASIVPGRDGIHVRYNDRDCYLTPDDLLSQQLYQSERPIRRLDVKLGLDSERALEWLADECETSVAQLLDEATWWRIVVERSVPDRPALNPSAITPADVSYAALQRSVYLSARYLARHLRSDGLFDYEIDATTGRHLPGYSWPRHAGAALYLAEAARFIGDRRIGRAAVRAARRLRDENTLACGDHVCVGQGHRVDLGSSALALLAYVEVVRAGLDESLLAEIDGVAEFLRSQQRPDGEFMHLYDRQARRALDVQLPYYTGEAALALARAYRLTRAPADLEASSRAIAYLTQTSRRFFGSRYWWPAEHWTCQAVEELWRRAPNPAALEFCLQWNAFNRSVQLDASTELGDYDGAYSSVDWFPPRICSAGSRSEGAVATLVTATYAGVETEELGRLEDQVRRAFAYLLRFQFAPGPTHLMREPASVNGGFPGSPFDWRVRIDLPQHAGSAMIRYLRLLEQRERGQVAPPP